MPRKSFPEKSSVWAILNELILYVLIISLHSISLTFHKPLIYVPLNFSFDRRVNLGHGYVYLLQFFIKFMKTWIKSESPYIHTQYQYSNTCNKKSQLKQFKNSCFKVNKQKYILFRMLGNSHDLLFCFRLCSKWIFVKVLL